MGLASLIPGHAPQPEAPPEPSPENKRAHVRHPFKGAAFRVRAADRTCEIRLRDLSDGGACGLMCEPLSVGEFVIVEFDTRHQIEAEVCWVRRFLVGLRFTSPLTPTFVERLSQKHAAPAPAP